MPPQQLSRRAPQRRLARVARRRLALPAAVTAALASAVLAGPAALSATAADHPHRTASHEQATYQATYQATRHSSHRDLRRSLVARHLLSRSAVDTSDAAAVATAYHAAFDGADQVGVPGVGGAVDPCAVTPAAATTQQRMLGLVNYARSLNGLDPVRLAPALSAKAQQAAVLMAANGTLDHQPPSSWRCWSKAGADGAAGSNLSITPFPMTVGTATEQYLDDWGDVNTAVGHRRWLMYPQATRVGVGLTATTNAYYVFGATSTSRANPRWVSWPVAGYSPAALEPQGRWSLSSGDPDADFSAASVSVTNLTTGAAVPVRSYRPTRGEGMPTLVWEVGTVDPAATYRVSVTGIRGTDASRRRYQVSFV